MGLLQLPIQSGGGCWRGIGSLWDESWADTGWFYTVSRTGGRRPAVSGTWPWRGQMSRGHCPVCGERKGGGGEDDLLANPWPVALPVIHFHIHSFFLENVESNVWIWADHTCNSRLCFEHLFVYLTNIHSIDYIPGAILRALQILAHLIYYNHRK